MLKGQDSFRIMNNIPEQIRRLREKSRLDQTDLAKLLGTSRVAIDRWERGDTHPSSQQAERLSALVTGTQFALPLARLSSVLQNGTFASRGSTRRALKSVQPNL